MRKEKSLNQMRADLKAWGFEDVNEMPDYVVENEHSAEEIDRAIKKYEEKRTREELEAELDSMGIGEIMAASMGPRNR